MLALNLGLEKAWIFIFCLLTKGKVLYNNINQCRKAVDNVTKSLWIAGSFYMVGQDMIDEWETGEYG